MTRMLSSKPSEDHMPFYALGINVAVQVGGELKGILNNEEIKAMLAGFSDSMLGEVPGADGSQEERSKAIMQQYGPALNQIIQVCVCVYALYSEGTSMHPC